MKINKKIFILSILGFILSILGITLMLNKLPKVGVRQISNNIAESKKNGFFIAEYECPQQRLMLSDSLDFIYRQAWVEQHWYYNKFYQRTSIVNSMVFYTDILFSKDIYQEISNFRSYFKESNYTGSRLGKNSAFLWHELESLPDSIIITLASQQDIVFKRK